MGQPNEPCREGPGSLMPGEESPQQGFELPGMMGSWGEHYTGIAAGQDLGLSPPSHGLMATRPSMGGGGMFRIDPDLAPQAIADLRHAAALLKQEVQEAEQLANIEPPGLDKVSAEAVRIFGEMAIGPQGSLRAALEGGVAELERQADKLEADLKTYLQVEEINTPPHRDIEL